MFHYNNEEFLQSVFLFLLNSVRLQASSVPGLIPQDVHEARACLKANRL